MLLRVAQPHITVAHFKISVSMHSSRHLQDAAYYRAKKYAYLHPTSGSRLLWHGKQAASTTILMPILDNVWQMSNGYLHGRRKEWQEWSNCVSVVKQHCPVVSFVTALCFAACQLMNRAA
jgi:hypothetical protein